MADDAERRAERVGVGVLVADGQDASRAAQPLDDRRPGRRRGTGARSTLIGGRRPRLRPAGPAAWSPTPRGAGPRRHDRGRAAPPAGRPRGAAARPASAATRRPAASSSGVAAGLELVRAAGGRACRARRCRRARTWRSGMRLSRSRRPSSCRTNGIAWPSAASGRVALGRLADDAHPDLGVAQVRRRLDVGDRREPDPRIRDLPGDDRRRSPGAAARRPARSAGSSRTAVAASGSRRARLTVCEVKHSMMSPSSRSWKLARPMPHS